MASLNQFAADPNQKQKQPGTMRPQTGTGIQGRPPMQAGPLSGPIADPTEMRKRLAGMPGLADIDRRRLDDAAGRGMGAVKDVVRGRPFEADVQQVINGSIGAYQNKMGGARPSASLDDAMGQAVRDGATGSSFDVASGMQAGLAPGLKAQMPPPGSQAGPAGPYNGGATPGKQYAPDPAWQAPPTNTTTFPGGDTGTGKPWYDGPPMGSPTGGWAGPDSGGLPPVGGWMQPKYDKAKAQSGYTSQDWGQLNKKLKALDPALVAQWREQMQGIQAGGGRRYDFLNQMLASQAPQGQSPPFNPQAPGQTAPIPQQAPPIYTPPVNPNDPPTQIPDIFLPF